MHSAISLIANFDKTHLEESLRALTTRVGVGFSKLAQPMRVAITGKSVSAGIFETMELLGKERTLNSLDYATKHLCERSETIKSTAL